MESISEELRIYSRGMSSVKFTTILPGVVTTGLAKNGRYRFPSIVGAYSPQQAASLIIDAQRQNLQEMSFPSYFLLMCTIGRILPKKAQICITDFLGIHFVAD